MGHQRKSQLLVPAAALFLVALLSVTGRGQQHSYVPKEGYVPDDKTAIRIAEAVLSPICGERKLAQERPFSASLQNEVWTVSGNHPDPHVLGGGEAIIQISKKDGRILGVTFSR